MNLKKVILFIALVFLINWLMAILFIALGGKWMMTPASLVVAISYMFVPMIIAIIVQRFIYKEPIKEALGISFKINRWFIVAWLLPVIIAVAAIGVSIVFPNWYLNFNEYKQIELIAYNTIHDSSTERESWVAIYPNGNYERTLLKAQSYWSSTAGHEKKKEHWNKSKRKNPDAEIDMLATYRKAIREKWNVIYNSPNENSNKPSFKNKAEPGKYDKIDAEGKV
jgi:hypothetical protein